MQEEKEEQRAGRNKKTTVDKTYISSGEYRNKFDKLTESKELNRLFYQLSKKMLLHRSGSTFEDMYWVDPETCTVVAEITDSNVEEKISYSDSVRRVIKEYEGLITIHSHPSGLPPSAADFNSNFKHGYMLGIVVGHNGRVYVYSSETFISEDYFELKVAMYRQSGYNEDEARTLAIKYCEQFFDIHYKEVSLDD